MPQGDGSKEICFKLWLQGKSVAEIAKSTTAKKASIQNWVNDWGRGRQKEWDVDWNFHDRSLPALALSSTPKLPYDLMHRRCVSEPVPRDFGRNIRLRNAIHELPWVNVRDLHGWRGLSASSKTRTPAPAFLHLGI